MPVSPLSPVLAKVITISSLLENVPLPERYEPLTVNHPVLSVNEEIVKSTKIESSNFLDTRKWPLMVDVESSIVFKKVDRFVAASFEASIYKAVAEVIVALLNLSLPVPGSAAVVVESKV